MMTNQSNVRHLLAQIDAEYTAAKQGLQGLAQGAAYHQFMTARSERIAALHRDLAEVVGDRDTATLLLMEHQARTDTQESR